jgi:flagellar basal-body rod protein FlgG
MAIQALNSAATGLRALSTSIDVVANNLANAETTAFKRSRVNFEDLMYVALKQPGAQNASGDISPTGIFVGLGVKVSNTTIDDSQGPLDNTNGPLDLAIQGPGFFKVLTIPSIGNGVAFTRAGNFILNNEGDLVLNIGDGYRLIPPINIPPGSTDISVGQDGTISYVPPRATNRTNAGQLQIAQFTNPQGLEQLGGSLYTQTEASGPAIESNPGEDGAGQTLQGFLEGSNVDPVKELVDLIFTQRGFELNSQSIQSADETLRVVTNLRRG